MIKTKRAHDRPARNDGTRILVDRIWPRGTAGMSLAPLLVFCLIISFT